MTTKLKLRKKKKQKQKPSTEQNVLNLWTQLRNTAFKYCPIIWWE